MKHRATRMRSWRVYIACCALGPAWALLLCSPAQAGQDSILWEGDDQSVALARQDDPAALPNDHPVTLAPGDIEGMLSSLRLKYADEESESSPIPVFDKEQLGILGEAVATGLARATPSQDIRFSVIGSHRISPGAFARRNRLTAGRVFYQDGHLNIIFGDLQSPYRKKNIYGQVDEDFYPRKFGSRESAESLEATLIAGADFGFHRGADGERNDWVIFDPALARIEAASPSEPTSPPNPAEPPPEVAPQPPASRPAAAAAPPVPAIAPSRPAAPDAGDENDVERRLEALKRLRDKGLISEDAYRKKMEDILGDL